MLESLGATACPSDHATSVHKMPSQSASRMMDVELHTGGFAPSALSIATKVNVIRPVKKIRDNDSIRCDGRPDFSGLPSPHPSSQRADPRPRIFFWKWTIPPHWICGQDCQTPKPGHSANDPVVPGSRLRSSGHCCQRRQRAVRQCWRRQDGFLVGRRYGADSTSV